MREGRKHSLLKEEGTKVWRGQVNLSTLPVGELRQAINISSLTIYDMGVTAHNVLVSCCCGDSVL